MKRITKATFWTQSNPTQYLNHATHFYYRWSWRTLRNRPRPFDHSRRFTVTPGNWGLNQTIPNPFQEFSHSVSHQYFQLRIPVNEQQIFYHGKRLNQASNSSLSSCGINSDEMLELKRVVSSSSQPDAPSAVAGGWVLSLDRIRLVSWNEKLKTIRVDDLASRNIAHDFDRMRLQMLGDPHLMSQLRAVCCDMIFKSLD